MDPSINLPEVLRLHALHLVGDPAGKRADLRWANLRWADLRGAILRGADLSGAVLRGADLREAVLRGASLQGADLRGADLSGADLRRADLRRADLSRADLRGAELSEANLCRADLRDADLTGVAGIPIAGDAPARLRAVAETILANPEAFDMSSWHSDCGTAHCLAGWAIHQAGPLGKMLEELHGPELSGRLLLGHEAASMFHSTNDHVLKWLASIAAE